MEGPEALKKLNDEELLLRYKLRGDQNALGILFKRYTHLVLGVCMKYLRDEDDSKDAASQIFEKLLSDLKKHEIGHFKAWLHTVTRNHCFMLLRTKSREISGLDPYVMETAGQLHLEDYSSESSLEKEKKLSSMEQALDQLESHQKLCIRLFYLEEKSYQQITEITGYNLNQVKSYIQNGKRNLKLMLNKNDS